jgi:phage terminase large subunit
MTEVEFPEKFRFLFKPAPYKCAYSGRYGLKSWTFSRALLVLGAAKPLRILCAREIQKSIKDSVHGLLKDQIQALGLGDFYQVLETEIRGKNGTQFLYSGLASHTIESIKSFEGVDIVWVEEARPVSERSWRILLPTIRKTGSEVWVSFNPELDDDPVYKRFVINPLPGCVTVKTSYKDAIEFGVGSDKIEELRLHDQANMKPAEYENVWNGKCLPAVTGAIYADEIAKAQEDGNITNVPYDPALKVHVVWDLGWNDSMFLILVQKHLSALRVIEVIEDDHKTYDWFSAELKKKNLNWGNMWLPHDAMHSTPETGRSPNRILSDLGWTCRPTPNQPVERGIKAARMAFPQIYFDKAKTDRLIQCLKRYRRSIPTTTDEPSTPVHDEYSHGADAFRYLALVAPMLSNEELFAKPIKYPAHGVV